MKTINRNWIARFAFAALIVAPVAVCSASAQNRSYGGGSGSSGGGGHYQAGRSYSGGGYSGGATGAGRASGAYAGRSYSSGGYHASGSGRSYSNGIGRGGSTSHGYYAAYAASTSGSFGGGGQAHLTMKPEVTPRIGSESSRVGGFNSFSSPKMPDVQHPTRVKQSRYTGMGSSTGKRNSKAPVQGVKVAPSAGSAKAYNKPVNMASRSVAHDPGSGSPNPSNY